MPVFSCPYAERTCLPSVPVSTEMHFLGAGPHQAQRSGWELKEKQAVPLQRSQLGRERVMKTNLDINSPARQVFSGHRGGNITFAGPSGKAFRSLWCWDWNANENMSHQVVGEGPSRGKGQQVPKCGGRKNKGTEAERQPEPDPD